MNIENQNLSLQKNLNNQAFIQPQSKPKRIIPRWIIAEVILAILLIIVLVDVFILPDIIFNLNKPKAPEINSQKILSTTGWKTFEGKSVGLSFKYPPSWQKVENEYVSQLQPTKGDLDENNPTEDKKVLNLIRVRRDSKEENSDQYNYTLERFNKMKSFPLNKESFEDEVNYIKVTKLKEGKLSSGEDFILFFRNDYGELGNFENLGIMVNGENVIYELTLDKYNDNGVSVLNNITPTIKLTNKLLEPKKFENEYFSINYPPGGDVNEITDIDGKKKIGFILNGDVNSDIIIDGTIQTANFDNFYDTFQYWDEAFYLDSKKDISELLKNPYYSKVTDIKDANGYRIYTIDKEFADSKKRIYILKDKFAMEIIYDRDSTADKNLLDKVISTIKLK